MTRIQRIRNFIFGLGMLICGLIIFLDPQDGYMITSYILTAFLAMAGIRGIVFYFVMARHMIDGMLILISGIFMLDLSAFTLTLLNLPRGYVIIYLLILHLLNGLKEILRGLEVRNYQIGRWKMKIAFGCANVLTALGALFFGTVLGSNHLVITVFSCGIMYSSVVCLLSAIRKNDEPVFSEQ